ncbi:fibronectin type III domain protein [Dictyocaulus viviparus]|uniref:Fibronectin type III domain protein n=1 Tax=Dictyocaulus viviparus TaxID=29172 RepID=A0A0D8Y747_DICVI|nr:fibronectin type III domain protein [Dictyocaulus viviparus]
MLIVGQILIMAFAIIIVDGRESRGVTETITSGSRLGNEIVIEKDQQLPHSQLIVHLPVVHTLFDQFIAKVVDISPSIESPIRDVNRTFLALSNDSRTIQLHTLHPGHTYSVAIIGRRGDSSSMMKEDEVTMDPYAPQFPIEDIDITMRNITLKVVKNEKYLQDRFLVNYRQLEPDKHYPILEILDIPEQKTLEIYIGNLNPGRDYVVDVVAVKSELKSKPWSATLSTKPSTVSNLTVSETGTSCLTVEWTIPTNSGADSFLVQYSKIGALSNHNIILPKSDREVHLCDDIIPGNIYKISVAVKKKTSQSAEKAVTYTVRPSKPEEFKIFPDITKGKYRLIVDLNSISHYDGCYVTVVSETLEKIERSEMLDGNDEAKKCSILLPLFPGERFEFTVSTFSHNVNSTKLHQSIALTPAFNMSGFGLTLQESRNGVELRWPQNDVFMARLRDIWNKVVGSTSQLQMRVFPTNGSGKGRRLYGNPYNATTLFIGPLKKGSCYKIQIFTVTKSGIVSETRFDEYFRMSAAPVNVSIHSITQTSAVINTVFISAGDVDPESVLNVVVIDMHGHVVFDKSQKSRDKIFSEIKLNGLRPYHKYTVNTKITCSSGPHDCSEAVRTMKQLTFSTMQDKPGPVLSPSVTALNPYSVQIEWLPPALPNGILTHYVINIVPEDSSLMSRSINVGTATNRSDHFLETIVDGLLGGERYNFTICAATQAGRGEVSTVLPELLRMPIMGEETFSSMRKNNS